MFLQACDEQKLELKKHVNAIHCTNNLTLVQRKLFNALLFNAYSELPYKSQFELPARKLCILIGYNSNDFAKLKQSLLALTTTAIEWNVVDYSSTQTAVWSASSIISSAKLENGVCTYEYSSLMRELLYHPDIYGRLDMTIIPKFKSSYGLALYENCIRYQGLSQTPWFPIEVFRKLMGVLGDKYAAFKDFKKRVLNIAIDEVNKHSSMVINSELKIVNQKVISIRFKLSNESCKKVIQSEATYLEDDFLVNTLSKNFNMSPESINTLFLKYEKAYLLEKINMILSSDAFKSGKIRGLGGYLIKALENNYLPNKTTQLVTESKTKKLLISKNQEILEPVKEEHEYNQYISEKTNEYLMSLEANELQNLVREFEQFMEKNMNFFLAKYKKYGLEHRPIKACYLDYVKRSRSSTIPGFMTLEQFHKLSDGRLNL